MRCRILILLVSLTLPASDAASAGCAEDLTRIQLALPNAAPDIQSRISGLVSDALEKARTKDGAGCEAATASALQSLGLPRLAPIVLSTPTTQQTGSNAPGPAQSSQPTAVANNTAPTAPAQPPTGGSQAPPQTAPANSAAPAAPIASATQAKSAPASGPADGVTQTNQFFVVSSDVIGLDVTNINDPNQTLGKLSSIIIDSRTGQARFAVIDRGGVLGWDRHHVIVPFSLLKFFGQWDRPSLNMDAFKLENGPHVADQDVETLLNDPAWLRSMARYFGVALATDQPAAERATPANSAKGTQSADGGGAAHGQTVAQRYCVACHTLNSGGNALVGPNLYGVVGRSVAGVPGFNYSDALKSHHGDWDAASLDAFLKSPRAYVPGTHMTFPGIASTRDRQDVIAYLQTLGGKTGANP
jgi:cytochrome c2